MAERGGAAAAPATNRATVTTDNHTTFEDGTPISTSRGTRTGTAHGRHGAERKTPEKRAESTKEVLSRQRVVRDVG